MKNTLLAQDNFACLLGEEQCHQQGGLRRPDLTKGKVIVVLHLYRVENYFEGRTVGLFYFISFLSTNLYMEEYDMALSNYLIRKKAWESTLVESLQC